MMLILKIKQTRRVVSNVAVADHCNLKSTGLQSALSDWVPELVRREDRKRKEK